MDETFAGATSFNCDLSSWDVGECFSMEKTFAGATSFTHQLGQKWVTSNADMQCTFANSPGSIAGRTKAANGSIVASPPGESEGGGASEEGEPSVLGKRTRVSGGSGGGESVDDLRVRVEMLEAFVAERRLEVQFAEFAQQREEDSKNGH